jgi:hypothetical protein
MRLFFLGVECLELKARGYYVETVVSPKNIINVLLSFTSTQVTTTLIPLLVSIPDYPHTLQRISSHISSLLFMEVYTTSFTYPRRSRHIHPAPSSIDFPVQELRNESYPHLQQTPTNLTDPAASDAIQKLALMAMSLHGCHVTYFVADQNRGWNFHITGAYQQVMATRGMILKECPIQVKGSAS